MRLLSLLTIALFTAAPALAQDEEGDEASTEESTDGEPTSAEDANAIGALLNAIPEIKSTEVEEEEAKPPPEITFPVYVKAVNDAVLSSWSPKKGALKNPRAETRLALKVSQDGTVDEVNIVSLSGETKFDKSVLDAINSTQRVDPPPPSLIGSAAQGVVVTFSAKWALTHQ